MCSSDLPKVIITLPLLEGLDGVQKMSKSLGNYVGITEAPEEMFGKLMSITDELMWRYFDLLSFRSIEEIADFKADVTGGRNPRDIKFLLCEEIIERFHSSAAAVAAREEFIARFQQGKMPEDLPEIPAGLAEVWAEARIRVISRPERYQGPGVEAMDPPRIEFELGGAVVHGAGVTRRQVEPALVHVEQIEGQHALVDTEFVNGCAETIGEFVDVETGDERESGMRCFHGFLDSYTYLDA